MRAAVDPAVPVAMPRADARRGRSPSAHRAVLPSPTIEPLRQRRYRGAKVSPRFRQPASRMIRLATSGSPPPLRIATRTLREHIAGPAWLGGSRDPLRWDRLTRDPRPWRRPTLTPGRRCEADAV